MEPIRPEEMVMWIRDHVVCGGETGTGNHHAIYHARCFACVRCQDGRPLSAGEHYGIRHGRVYCRVHFCQAQPDRLQVRGGADDVWGPTTTAATPPVRRTGRRGRPRKLPAAVRPPPPPPPPPDNPSPVPCETAVKTADTEPRKLLPRSLEI